VEYLKSLGLTDCWKSNDDRVTYKTGQTRLDRIMYRMERNFKKQLNVYQTFTTPDHCMLQLYLLPDKQKIVTRRTVSLPKYLIDNKVNVDQIKKGMVELMCNKQWPANVKSNVRLRTTVGEVLKNLNEKVKDELEDIQGKIIRRAGFKCTLPLSAYEENKENKEALDLLFAKRNLILEERSKRLAEKFKTKWFHEGEKSNKYFLNMLCAKKSQIDIDYLNTDRGVVRDDLGIKNEIKTFYKSLYKHGSVTKAEVDESYFQYAEKVQTTEMAKITAPLMKDELYDL
jgi:hypothetical protein